MDQKKEMRRNIRIELEELPCIIKPHDDAGVMEVKIEVLIGYISKNYDMALCKKIYNQSLHNFISSMISVQDNPTRKTILEDMQEDLRSFFNSDRIDHLDELFINQYGNTESQTNKNAITSFLIVIHSLIFSQDPNQKQAITKKYAEFYHLTDKNTALMKTALGEEAWEKYKDQLICNKNTIRLTALLPETTSTGKNSKQLLTQLVNERAGDQVTVSFVAVNDGNYMVEFTPKKALIDAPSVVPKMPGENSLFVKQHQPSPTLEVPYAPKP